MSAVTPACARQGARNCRWKARMHFGNLTSARPHVQDKLSYDVVEQSRTKQVGKGNNRRQYSSSDLPRRSCRDHDVFSPASHPLGVDRLSTARNRIFFFFEPEAPSQVQLGPTTTADPSMSPFRHIGWMFATYFGREVLARRGTCCASAFSGCRRRSRRRGLVHHLP